MQSIQSENLFKVRLYFSAFKKVYTHLARKVEALQKRIVVQSRSQFQQEASNSMVLIQLGFTTNCEHLV